MIKVTLTVRVGIAHTTKKSHVPVLGLFLYANNAMDTCSFWDNINEDAEHTAML